jgi:hypothetical protein
MEKAASCMMYRTGPLFRDNSLPLVAAYFRLVVETIFEVTLPYLVSSLLQ